MTVSFMHYAPYFLATAGAFTVVVALLPQLKQDIVLRRWYQPLLMLALGTLALVVVGTIIVSSPWLGVGGILLAALIASAITVAARVRGKSDEPLTFLQALVNVMSANLDLLQALELAARSADFQKSFPHMSEACRQIIARVDAGEPLSAAIETVSDATPQAHRQIWNQCAALAHMIEDQALSLESQRETLTSYWRIALEVYDINRGMKQDMAQMEAAKILFLLIIPGLNLYMWRSLENYEAFATSTLGMVVLIFEAVALTSMFIAMSLIQKLPEVQI